MSKRDRSGDLLGQIRDLVSWLGEGRRLTQTDRIVLADARELVTLLGTGDTIDPVYAGSVSKTKSSAELGGLDELVEWAKAAGLIRVVKHRLVPVKKHAKTLAEPEPLRRALFRGLSTGNFAVSPEFGWRARSLLEIDYDLGFDTIVSILYIHPGTLAIDKIACTTSATAGTTASNWSTPRPPRSAAPTRTASTAPGPALLRTAAAHRDTPTSRPPSRGRPATGDPNCSNGWSSSDPPTSIRRRSTATWRTSGCAPCESEPIA